MKETTVVHTVDEVRAACDAVRGLGKGVSLVPTMGALHEGHLALVDEAHERGEFVVVTIFVNPTQFNDEKDLERYPRTLDADREKLSARNTDLIFAPESSQMYPKGHATTVRVEKLTDGFCGAHRPGHFDGVATIVSKLFNMVGPCTAIFGRKDYQQLQVIKRMVVDLDMPIQVIGVPTVRDPDGLAMSSRNAHLSVLERRRALTLSRGLSAAHSCWNKGERNVEALRKVVLENVAGMADHVDYITTADPDDLTPYDAHDTAGDRLLIAIAATVGKTRLIDNTVLGEDTAPTGENK